MIWKTESEKKQFQNAITDAVLRALRMWNEEQKKKEETRLLTEQGALPTPDLRRF